MSWSQARAITRVAEKDDGVDWVDLARHSSAAQLERVVRGVRRAQQNELAEADPEQVAYQLRTRARYDDHGNLVLTIYAPAEHAPVIVAGIEAQRTLLEQQRAAHSAAPNEPEAVDQPGREPVDDTDAEQVTDPAVDPVTEPEPPAEEEPAVPAGTLTPAAIAGYFEYVDELAAEQTWDRDAVAAEPSPPVPADTPPAAPAALQPPVAPGQPQVTDGEALVAMAQAALAAQQAKHPAIARRHRSRLIAHVDPLSGWARLHDGELLPPSSLKAVLKTLPGRGGVVRLRPITAADLTRHDLGRNAREANQPLREHLGAVDGERCRFPGCSRRRKLHAHHVVFWSEGGRTDFGNLVLLCSRHHTLVHKGGFVLVLHDDRRLDVTTAEGVRLLHHPGQPWGDPDALDPTGSVSAGTLPPTDCSARMDLGYVVHVLRQQAA
jgi:hypothetical protein